MDLKVYGHTSHENTLMDVPTKVIVIVRGDPYELSLLLTYFPLAVWVDNFISTVAKLKVDMMENSEEGFPVVELRETLEYGSYLKLEKLVWLINDPSRQISLHYENGVKVR